jgi:hypothetical protein
MKKTTFSEQVKFHPFIGENYEGQEHKILMLGESHYTHDQNEQQDKNGTIKVISDWLNDDAVKQQFRFFGELLKVLYGKVDNAKEQFGNICFYNYVQKWVQTGTKPTAEMWKSAEEPFKEVVRKLIPDSVFCFGIRMWEDGLPQGGKESVVCDYLPEKAKRPFKKCVLDEPEYGKSLTLYMFYHPSARRGEFNSERYHEIVSSIPQFKSYAG